MLKDSPARAKIDEIVAFFSDYDTHKSHGRSIDRAKATELGLKVTYMEKVPGLTPLIRSLNNQYELFFDKTTFYKLFENPKGINWGRQSQSVSFQMPMLVPAGSPLPAPQPGPPEPSK